MARVSPEEHGQEIGTQKHLAITYIENQKARTLKKDTTILRFIVEIRCASIRL